MRAALRARLVAVIDEHLDSADDSEQSVAVTQEIHHVQIESPPDCPPTSVLRTSSTATVAAARSVRAVRAMARDVVADKLVAVADAYLSGVTDGSPPGSVRVVPRPQEGSSHCLAIRGVGWRRSCRTARTPWCGSVFSASGCVPAL
jgi:hypothetical protein